MSVGIIKWIVIGYIIIINVYGFLIMGIDKQRAIRSAWRIPERSLFLTAIIGGSIGTIAGMKYFRHKTKHWYFKYGMPAILLIQIILVIIVLYEFR
jgi:uncharacterized membrane protein YsdA (DUF1294 family)